MPIYSGFSDETVGPRPEKYRDFTGKRRVSDPAT
jgi:hypothetical protein